MSDDENKQAEQTEDTSAQESPKRQVVEGETAGQLGESTVQIMTPAQRATERAWKRKQSQQRAVERAAKRAKEQEAVEKEQK